MTAAATLKTQLLEVSTLPSLMVEINEILKEERKKRNAFYEWVDADVKVEFINGEIIENSPVTNEHSDAVTHLLSTTHIYTAINDLGKVKSEKAMVSLTRNDYEPDVVFWKNEKAKHFKAKQLHFPAPDWVVEVLSPGTKDRDRGVKYDDYAAHGVKEYWIVDPDKHTVEQYLLSEETGDTYELYKKLRLGDIIESVVITGFRIPVSAIFDAEANKLTILDLMKK